MLLIKTKRQLLTRLPLFILVIILFGLSPILTSVIGATVIELLTGQPCHEGNCTFGAIGWLFIVTLPVAMVILLILLIIVILDIIQLSNREQQIK